MKLPQVVTLMTLTAAVAIEPSGVGQRHRRAARRERHQRKGKGGPSPDDHVQLLEQPLDHYDRSPKAAANTWQQRYWVNTTFYDANPDRANAPVFLCVGGESDPMHDDILITGEEHCALMLTAAAEHGALVAAVEHRFYNPKDAYPVADLSVDNLRFLSSTQAQADLAAFHLHLSTAMDLTDSNRWVTWGGSYPGVMAAWTRYKYPHLFYAAVSSSAPVENIANMEGYNNVVAKAIADEAIGGSEECLSVVKASFSQIGDMLVTQEGRASLMASFNVSTDGPSGADPLSDPLNQEEFTTDLSYLPYSQSNDPSSDSLEDNGALTCAVLLDESNGEPLEGLVALKNAVYGTDAMGVEYADSIAYMADESLDGNSDTDVFCERCWFYQTCTEVGFYQTCDPDSACPFTSTPWVNTLSMNLDLCTLTFGISNTSVLSNVDTSNAQYGGRSPDIDRILYVNGADDPWSSQSILESSTVHDLPAIVVEGASHHPWTHPSLDSDQQSVKDARVAIRAQVSAWLALA